MFKSIDWKFLRRPIIIFTVLLLSSIIFYIGGEQFKGYMKVDFDTAKNTLDSSYSKLQRQSKEIALVDKYLKKYKVLVNSGLVGEERRLSWIESMKATNETIKLPTFNYLISAQEDYLRPGLKPNKTVKILSSKMTLNLGLLHEEDLFSVFDLIHSNVQSKFVIDSCDMYTKQNKELKVNDANMTAECRLHWVRLSVAGKK